MNRLIALGFSVAALSACAGFPLALPDPGTGLSETDIAAGLKEALSTGTERAVARVGQPDGYWLNPRLRIPLPDNLKKTERLLRSLGQDRHVDEFHLSLNRAAEQAAPEAVAIFGNAIRQMTLADARRILNGPPDAATRYFQDRTTPALTARFRPIVSKATDATGATRNYKNLVSRAGRLVSSADFQALDLDGYVTERALAGLFTTLADEERLIRENPAARTSELLRRVFGGN
jgi:hypothetical protein